jgi:D-alanyl-D-alanine carboxypeptidase (penicillin-binding protein 5/6)
MQLIGVVLGAQNGMASATASKALLSYGFQYYSSQLLYKAGDVVGNVEVAGGNPASIPLTVAQDFYVTAPSSVLKQLHADLQLPKTLNAPLNKGAVVGTLIVTANGQTVGQAQVVTAVAVTQASWWQSIKNKVSGWF